MEAMGAFHLPFSELLYQPHDKDLVIFPPSSLKQQ